MIRVPRAFQVFSLPIGVLFAVGPVQAADGPSTVAQASRAAPIPVPLEAPHRRPAAAPASVLPGLVFVNFDGAELAWGWDDAATNKTQISQMVGTFAPYGDDAAKRAAVMQAVREDWAPYDVTMTDERPVDGEYTMCMVGPTNPFGANVLGIAPLDCGDSQTHGNITYAFHSATDGMAATTAATTGTTCCRAATTRGRWAGTWWTRRPASTRSSSRRSTSRATWR